MSAFYAVNISVLTESEDRRVDRRVNRKAAEAVARRLNRIAMAQYGLAAPLFYVQRVDEKNAEETRAYRARRKIGG